MHAPPRAMGAGQLRAKRRGDATALDDLRMSGCLKLLFARNPARLDAVMLNTSGGLTGGDRLCMEAVAGPGAQMSLTTQAAERAYRAASGRARVETDLDVGDGATLFWLPQELILFDGAALARRLTCRVAPGARFLMVEPVVFGRAAMGETVQQLDFEDRIAVDDENGPLYRDRLRLDGDMTEHLARGAVAGGAGAMALVLYVADDAEAYAARLRPALPATGALSLLSDRHFGLRLLAADSFALRGSLLPVLDALTGHTLPPAWRL